GTAVRRLQDVAPATDVLIPQALTANKHTLDFRTDLPGALTPFQGARTARGSLMFLRLVIVLIAITMTVGGAVCTAASGGGSHRSHSSSGTYPPP
ncbi:MAG: hypothetical protein ACRELY_12820, partial [Polyangiaceae bacterium]